MRTRLPLFCALIVTASAACDNVQWGGSDIDIVPPPPAAGNAPVEPDAQVFADLGMPTGTVLFHLTRDGNNTQLIPVAEVSGDSLRTLRRPAGVSPEAYQTRFREAVIPQGAQFEVFRRGAEVGTFVVQDVAGVTPCGVPIARGNLTTVAAAADVPQFLAFRSGLAPDTRGEYSPPQISGPIRTFASLVAERLVLQNGLPRPRSWPGAQRDLQAIEIRQGSNPEMAATYLVGDSLAVGPADPQGYSIFYIADYDRKRGYTPIYTEVRNYAQGEKAAPQLVDYLNWDRDPEEEILVRVFGPRQSWYEVLSTRNGELTRVWQGAEC